MDVFTEEQYLISRAKSGLLKDPYEAKAWIITAKTLYPNDFGIQFEAYKLEKSENNYEEAAKCFSYIVVTFQNQSVDLWNELSVEISNLTAALRRVPESGMSGEQDFYFKMFQHISSEVQHKILLLTANHSESNLDHCRMILLLLKRFPQAISTHIPRLLETLVQGVPTNPQYRTMLINETLPLVLARPVELSSDLVHRILNICLEHYVGQLLKEDDDKDKTECWRKIFDIVETLGGLLKWEPFLPYNRTWSKEIYWQKLIKIVSSAPPKPSENKQILFLGSILFIFALQEYIDNITHKIQDTDVSYILVEGFRDDVGAPKRRLSDGMPGEAVKIAVNPPCNVETPNCLITAAHCWQLLHSNEILQMDFGQLLMNLPITEWVNHFLLDLAVYLGRNDDIHANLQALKDTLDKQVRLLSLSVSQENINVAAFNHICTILSELPTISGTEYLRNLCGSGPGRHLVLLPLTRKAITQYCTKALVTVLKKKVLHDSSCSSAVLGNLLVLLQLDWPLETAFAETIFDVIRTRRNFTYHQFSSYIINIDMIEEFTYMWNPQGEEIRLELTVPQAPKPHRIGTRGSDKGVKEDFKHIIRQQIARSGEDIDTLVAQFIVQERLQLIQCIFES
ncbi:integrator complex subunit 10 [Lutzomyia longipalpis]|uniref:integrator complex subunit 10 n=1 Tax=Lutzomyia longipalpis TaxID=7200 RepID=UPI002483F215|nr:integrator complex subunit 10 [Lutzomyia longipalpis]